MIKCEYFNTRKDGVLLVKTYSTENKYIKQVETGLEYNEAIDYACSLGIENAFVQEGGTVGESFIPPFDLEGV